MSMTTHILLQFTGISIAYMCIMLLLPGVMFRRILRGRRVAEQFLFCYTFGNFYIINIVFVLQLLHISNWLTLVLLTTILSVLIWSKVEKISLKNRCAEAGNYIRKWLQGTLGIRTIWYDFRMFLWNTIKRLYRTVYKYIIKKPIQCFFFALLMSVIFWVYGRQLLLTYGYRASDIPVHLMWINQMSRKNLFCSGIYPFGYHCVIYYLHTVFRVDTYVILCQFFFAQVIFAHLVLLTVLKLCCKSKYLPYLGIIVYAGANIWRTNTYSRYFSTLPQEYGMIFVLPSIYFLFCFFQRKKEQLKEKETYLVLGMFAMAFSLTLAIHFYGTMIAGLCCIGIAGGYCFRFFQKPYFTRIIVTGIISIFLAILPMGIAFIGGTPLQGSIGWGMSVINGTSGKNNNNSTTVNNSSVSNSETANKEGTDRTEITENTSESVGEQQSQPEGKQESTEQQLQTEEQADITVQNRIQKLKNKVQNVPKMMAEQIIETVLDFEDIMYGYIPLAIFALLIPLGILFCIFRQVNYGAMLISTGLCMFILTILLCAGRIGLPPLMDSARCSIYFAYLLPIAVTFLCDGVIYLIFLSPVLQVVRNIVSLGVTGVVIITGFQNHMVKISDFGSQYVTNESITCLDNIIYENEDSTWTIVSANDETQMGLDHGWHYEIISFLRKMENLHQDTEIKIPTKNVYIFIEKVPVDYAIAYSGSGQSVSEKGAAQPLTNGAGLQPYQGKNRWILMSRMYYWAQAFKAQYPNEMQVYYETDQFVCYKIEQNMYHLYNFAIDYGYNQVLDMEK